MKTVEIKTAPRFSANGFGTVRLPAPPQSDVVREVSKLHGEICSSARGCLDMAIRIGGLLDSVREGLAHGQWLRWVETNLPFCDQTARNYMLLYAHRDDPKFKSILNLVDGYKLLREPKRDKRGGRRKRRDILHVLLGAWAKAGPETRKLFLRWARKAGKNNQPHES